MKCTYSDMKAALPNSKSSIDTIWCKMWVRKVALLLASCLQNMGVSANQVSLAAIFEAIAAGIFLSIDNSVCRGIGVGLFVFWICIDCIDGNLARYNKTGSLIGEFFDAVGGYTFYAVSYVSVGIAAYHTTSMVHERYRYILIIIGALGSIGDMLARLIYQKYTANMFQIEMEQHKGVTVKKDIDLSKRDRSMMSIVQLISREMGQAGFYSPLLVVAAIGNAYDTFIVAFSLYSVSQLLFSAIRYLLKASKAGKVFHG